MKTGLEYYLLFCAANKDHHWLESRRFGSPASSLCPFCNSLATMSKIVEVKGK